MNGPNQIAGQATVPAAARIDAIVIGRNEGTRLEACLASLRGKTRRIIYVDSGSTDDSPAMARTAGAIVVALDLSQPFTAARARNAGLAALPDGCADFVQMIDGDCTVAAGWLDQAASFLDSRPQAALVCGRRRERFPQASIYNLLCDWEWNTPVGPARACGGDALIRLDAIKGIGGYRDDVIAAEDDEMCQRLRAAGWQLWRIDAEMTGHDAAIRRFGQWWRRAVRAGHGFAEVGALHPGYFAAERRRVLLWGAVLPVVVLAGLLVWPPLAVGVLALYALSLARMALRLGKHGMPFLQALRAAGLITLSKFPNLQGVLIRGYRRLHGRAATIIEYK